MPHLSALFFNFANVLDAVSIINKFCEFPSCINKIERLSYMKVKLLLCVATATALTGCASNPYKNEFAILKTSMLKVNECIASKNYYSQCTKDHYDELAKISDSYPVKNIVMKYAIEMQESALIKDKEEITQEQFKLRVLKARNNLFLDVENWGQQESMRIDARNQQVGGALIDASKTYTDNLRKYNPPVVIPPRPPITCRNRGLKNNPEFVCD